MKSMIAFNTQNEILIYINEELIYQDHNISTETMFELVKRYKTNDYKSIYISEETQQKLGLWEFPENINDLPQEILDEINW